jgi:peptidoglycan/xylan/chitin deacetylase (PgdA/CDA1 family)
MGLTVGDWLRARARRLREIVLYGFRAASLFERIATSDWRSRKLLILCYHGVSLLDEHEWKTELFVTPSFLRRRLEILKKYNCVVLPLGEAVTRLRAGTLPPRSVVLTFDDGFYDFLAAAVPILEEFGYPATNYVSSYYSMNQRPMHELTLRYLLWRAREQTLAADTFPGQSESVDLGDSRQHDAFAEKLLRDACALEDDRIAQLEWLKSVATRLGEDWNRVDSSRILHLLNSVELAEVSARGFDIQLHTHRHRTPRDKDEFVAEVTENRRILEQSTGQKAKHFCYPSGDLDAVFLPWLRELKVESATTGESRLANASDDPLLLPRYVDTMLQPEVVFESWVCGMVDLMKPRRKKDI